MTEQVIASTEAPEQTGAAAETPAAQAAASDATPEQSAVPSNGEAGTTQEQPKQQDNQGYIRRLQAQRARERARAEQLAAEKAQLEAKLAAVQPATSQRPDPQQYQDYNEFIRADAAFVAKQAATQAMQEAQAAQARAAEQAEAQRMNDSWMAKQDAARERYADFDEAIDWLPGQIPPSVLPVLAHSEHGADIVYYLGKHPEELERIQRLPAALQVREAWSLEAKARPAPKQTQAPTPLEPVKSTGVKDTGYRPDMTQEEYAAYRARRKGRTT